MKVVVSGLGMDDYEGQFREATRYLVEHREILREITNREDVEDAILDFGVEAPENPVFMRRLPRALVGHAAVCRLSVELSFYRVAESESEADQNPECPTS